MTLIITESLARTVLPLSTNAFYGQLVSLNAAFFRVWRLTRRICLLDHLSFASLAGYSRSLNPYAFFPINQFSLASLPEPHSLASVVLSIFKHIPEQSFAFELQSWNRTNYLHFLKKSLYQMSYLRTYQDVLLQLLHTLLDTEYNTPHVFCLAGYSTILYESGQVSSFFACIAILPFLARSDSITTC